MKKFKMNEDWELEEVEDLNNLFVVLLKHGSFDAGYTEAFDTDDIKMQGVFDNLVSQYTDTGCDDLTHIYLIKVPNTKQVVSMLEPTVYNGNSNDPTMLSLLADVYNRADCEQIAHWAGAGLTEAKKKKYPFSSATVATGDIGLNIKHFNKCMGTDGLGNPADHPHLVVGDTLPNGPVASTTDTSTSDGGEAGGDGGNGGVSEELSLDEASSLSDYDKVRMCDTGARVTNVGAASTEKLQRYYKIAVDNNFKNAARIYEDELVGRGAMVSRLPVNLPSQLLMASDFTTADVKLVADNTNNAQAIFDTISANNSNDRCKKLIVFILIALWAKEKVLAAELKDILLNKFRVSLVELKNILKTYLDDVGITARLNSVVYASGIFVESLKEATNLTEDKIWAERVGDYYELPSELKILPKQKVEDFVSALEPEEYFNVGYVTPIYFYRELDDKFTLLKATQLEGYTGMDYRDAAGAEVADHGDRVARAKAQIAANPNGAHGHMLNREGDKFSAEYTKTNKLVRKRDAIGTELETNEVDEKGDTIVTNTILNRILFYPKVGSKPKVVYYLDVKAGKGFEKVDRKFLVDILYKKVQELAFAKDNGIKPEDRKIVQKWGFKDIIDFAQQYPGMSIADYKNALKMNIDPKLYLQMFPFNRRWTMKDFTEKVQKTIASDASTIADASLDAVSGYDFNFNTEAKPQVRALYTNQVYYLEKPGEKLGTELHEGLTEGLRFDPDAFEDIVLDSKVRDWYAGNNPYEFQLEDIPEDLTWKEVIDAINEGKYDDVKTPPDTEPRENIWKKGCQIYYAKYGKLPEKDLDAQSYLTKLIDDKETYDNVVNDEYLVDYESKAPGMAEALIEEAVKLDEAKRYVKRYYIRPQNIFCSNKEEILKALVQVGDDNCSVYSLKSLADHDDVHLLKPSDIIYYYDDGILYDKNHVKVMDYDLFVKHEEERKKFGNIDAVSDSTFEDEYDDRLTDADLKDKEIKVRKPTHESVLKESKMTYTYTKETFKAALDAGEIFYDLGANGEVRGGERRIFSDGGYFGSRDFTVYFDKDDGKYHVDEIEYSNDGDQEFGDEVVFDDFEEFYDYIKNNILNADDYLILEDMHEEAFNLKFESINVFGEVLNEGKDDKFTCCICGEESVGYGNNPEPYKHEGKCCDACNRKFVIPARLAANIEAMVGEDDED